MTTVDAPTRPPRPSHVDPAVLLEVARVLGMKPTEIINVEDTDAGRVVTTHDQNQLIIVSADRPDGLGQHGVLLYRGATPKGQPIYHDENAALRQQGQVEPWTTADLDQEAARVHVPAATGGRNGPSHNDWIGADPIRARALWLQIAREAACNPTQVVHRSSAAAHCRRVVLESGWLAETEARAL